MNHQESRTDTSHDPPPDQASQRSSQGDAPQQAPASPAALGAVSRSISPTTPFSPDYHLQLPPASGHHTPLKFAATSNAFNLAVSPTSSSSSRDGQQLGSAALLNNERSPPQAGSSTTRRLRRPSMLSLAQPTGPGEVDMSRENSSGGEESSMGPAQSRLSEVSPTDTRSHPFAFGQPAARWGGPSSLFASAPTSSSSSPNARTQAGQLGAPEIESLRTSPAIITPSEMGHPGSGETGSPMEMELGEEQRSPLRFLPSHLQTSASRRKGKGKMEDPDPAGPTIGRPGSTPHPEGEQSGPTPFAKKPLPASLVATLISEHAPLEHEIQSEARLQRFIHSHPARPPLTPRMSKSTRGRFPEMADDDDDDDTFGRPSWRGRQWVGMRSDSDSDTDDEGEPVNSAFAAGMDLDRPMSMSSSSSSAVWPSGNVSESGKMTPGSGSGSGPSGQAPAFGHASASGVRHPTPPHAGAAFGGAPRPARMSFGAGMVSSPGTGFQLPGAFGGLGMGGGGTPLGSPTVERLELGASPGAVSASSPGLMQYRESQGGSASVRPGKRKAQQEDRYDPYKRPRGSSPSLAPMSPSQRTGAIPIPSSPFAASNSTRRAYARPLSSRSRQASPALSIGSTSGVLSTSLGNGNGKGLGSSFIPTGPAAVHAAQHAQGPQLGSLGLLSLANVGEDIEGEGAEEGQSSGRASREDSENRRSGSRGGGQDHNDAMEED